MVVLVFSLFWGLPAGSRMAYFPTADYVFTICHWVASQGFFDPVYLVYYSFVFCIFGVVCFSSGFVFLLDVILEFFWGWSLPLVLSQYSMWTMTGMLSSDDPFSMVCSSNRHLLFWQLRGRWRPVLVRCWIGCTCIQPTANMLGWLWSSVFHLCLWFGCTIVVTERWILLWGWLTVRHEGIFVF